MRPFFSAYAPLLCGVLLALFTSCKKTEEAPAPPAPVISTISPNTGPAGTPLTISGSGFGATPGDNLVRVNGKVATCTAATTTELVALVPQAAGTGPVTVEVDGRTGTGPLFTYQPVGIRSVAPRSGRYDDSVTIHGFGFSTTPGDNVVRFNGRAAIVQSATPTDLVVLVPKGADTGPLTVQVAGQGNPVSGGDFAYVYTGTVTTFASGFYVPSGLAVGSQGQVYVADYGTDRILQVSPTGAVSTLAGSVSGFANGPGAMAQFADPVGVAVGAAGQVYVSDNLNHCIREISTSGFVSTLAGTPGQSGATNGPGNQAQFNRPARLAVDLQGTLLVAGGWDNLIRRVTPAGMVSTLAGGATGNFADGPALQATFYSPTSVAVDAQGSVYVTESDANRIRKISPDGQVSSLVGVSHQYGYADGPLATARFSFPYGIAVDRQGNVYVSEAVNCTIRRISTDGQVTTIAGKGGQRGYADGRGLDARFNYPYGLAIDAQGVLYLADGGNRRVCRVVVE